MDAVVAMVHRLVLRQDDGQDLIEYGLLAALIAIVAIVAMTMVGTTVNSLFWQTFPSAI
jgi:Flp pilus assembly pilin Flp